MAVTESEDVDELDEVELAVVAHRVRGRWRLDDLPDRALLDVAALERELQAYAASAVALLSVGEDFAVIARPGDPVRLVLSDLTAATEWSLARSVAERLGLEVGDDDEPEAAGDLGLLVDLGLSADDLAALVDDESHPDDLLVGVADELGFADELEDALDGDEDDDDSEADTDDALDDLDPDDDLDVLDDDELEDLDDEDDDEELEDEPGDDEE
ncbi:tRNA adenosine deaminase-associated protein [Nocardioides marmoraquaticus]